MAACGTRSAYNSGCRCDDCRRAQREYAAQQRKKRTAPVHGTASGYANHGCRCEKCTEAGRLWNREAAEKRRERGRGEPPSHGVSGYRHFGCRCEVCREAARRHVPKEKRQADYRRKQDATLDRATRHYQQWTGPELELASRSDLTNRQVAEMIGRTLCAVRNMRAKLQVDPRKINAAGKPHP